MPKKSKHIKLSKEGFLKYFGENTPKREKHAFEKQVMQDRFDEEAFEGLSELNPGELKEDLNSLTKLIEEKTKNDNKTIKIPPIWKYAAAIFIVAGIGSILFYITNQINNKEQLAQKKEMLNEEILTDSSKSFQLPDTIIVSENIRYGKEEKKQNLIIAQPGKMADNAYHTEVENNKNIIIPEISGIQEIPPQEITLKNDAKSEEIIVKGPGENAGVISGFDAKESDIFDDDPRRQRQISKKIVEGPKYKNEFDKVLALDEKNVENKENEKTASANNFQLNEKPVTGVPANIKDLNYKPVIGTDLIRITGEIKDASTNEALPGANVLIKGSNYGTVTDVDGKFILEVPETEGITLSSSYIGYITQDIVLNNQTNLNIKLEEDYLAMEEVVVVGYGAQRKSGIKALATGIDFDDESSSYNLVPPKPVIGKDKYKKYLADSIRYGTLPVIDREIAVKLRFTVKENGEIKDIEVVKSQGDAFDNEAIRLIKEGPAWEPAKENGVPVAKKVRVSVKFHIK